MCRSFTQIAISGRLSTSSMTLPMNKDAIRPHTSCGCDCNNSGPGLMP